MIRSLWISKTGLDAQQTQLDVVSNNLANVGTTGFKRARVQFEDLLYQTVRQAGANTSQQTQLPTGLQVGTGVRPTATPRMFTQATCRTRATSSTSRSTATASSRSSCPTAPPRTRATARFTWTPMVRW